MSDEVKKISFGFSKLAKKTSIVPSQLRKTKVEDNKVEFIDCLESKSIRLKDPVILKEKLLVIPLSKQTVDISTNIKDESNTNKPSPIEQINPDAVGPIDIKTNVVSLGISNKDSEILSPGINSNVDVKKLTLDEIAAKEILDDLNNKKDQGQSRIFSVPITNSAREGEKESTLDDYDNVPVTEFGMAMLRGMGWAPGKGVGKNEKLITPALPTLRPKGMGLGADKVVKVETNSKLINEDFKMCKGSFVRIIAGTHKDCYGQIEGFDDESGRVIVKLALANNSVSLNEFMVQLVDKVEYTKNSKVINVAKYEQYKNDQGKEENNKQMIKIENKTEHEIKVKKMSSDTKQNKLDKYNHRNNSSSSASDDSYYRPRPRSKSPKDKKHSKNKLYKRSRSNSRGPISVHERDQSRYSRSPTKHSSVSKSRYEKKYSLEEKTVKVKSSRRYDSSSDSVTDSSGYSRNKKSVSKKKKHKSRSRSLSPKYHTDSSDYSRNNKKTVTKKKKHKHKSRSRSRSPKHKKKR